MDYITRIESHFDSVFKKLTVTEKKIKLDELIRKKSYYGDNINKLKIVETKIKYIHDNYPEYVL